MDKMLRIAGEFENFCNEIKVFKTFVLNDLNHPEPLGPIGNILLEDYYFLSVYWIATSFSFLRFNDFSLEDLNMYFRDYLENKQEVKSEFLKGSCKINPANVEKVIIKIYQKYNNEAIIKYGQNHLKNFIVQSLQNKIKSKDVQSYLMTQIADKLQNKTSRRSSIKMSLGDIIKNKLKGYQFGEQVKLKSSKTDLKSIKMYDKSTHSYKSVRFKQSTTNLNEEHFIRDKSKEIVNTNREHPLSTRHKSVPSLKLDRDVQKLFSDYNNVNSTRIDSFGNSDTRNDNNRISIRNFMKTNNNNVDNEIDHIAETNRRYSNYNNEIDADKLTRYGSKLTNYHSSASLNEMNERRVESKMDSSRNHEHPGYQMNRTESNLQGKSGFLKKSKEYLKNLRETLNSRSKDKERPVSNVKAFQSNKIFKESGKKEKKHTEVKEDKEGQDAQDFVYFLEEYGVDALFEDPNKVIDDAHASKAAGDKAIKMILKGLICKAKIEADKEKSTRHEEDLRKDKLLEIMKNYMDVPEVPKPKEEGIADNGSLKEPINMERSEGVKEDMQKFIDERNQLKRKAEKLQKIKSQFDFDGLEQTIITGKRKEDTTNLAANATEDADEPVYKTINVKDENQEEVVKLMEKSLGKYLENQNTHLEDKIVEDLEKYFNDLRIESKLLFNYELINLSNCNLKSPQIKYLACRYPYYHSVKSINLSGNEIGDKSGVILINLLTRFSHNLHYLNLNNTQIGSQTLNSLQLFFSTDTCRLIGLRIAHNQFNDHDICKLSFGLCFYKKLKTLDIENTKICKIGANAVCNIIKENHQLHFLNISGNSFETTSIILLNKVISTHPQLRSLSMRNCLLGNYEIKYFADCLGKNRSLVYLDLSFNKLSNLDCDFLGIYIKFNKLLSFIYLYGNNDVTHEGITKMKKHLKDNDSEKAQVQTNKEKEVADLGTVNNMEPAKRKINLDAEKDKAGASKFILWKRENSEKKDMNFIFGEFIKRYMEEYKFMSE